MPDPRMTVCSAAILICPDVRRMGLVIASAVVAEGCAVTVEHSGVLKTRQSSRVGLKFAWNRFERERRDI